LLEAANIVVRLAQYALLSLLFGASMFGLYGLPARTPIPKSTSRLVPRLAVVAGSSFVTSVAGVMIQTGLMSGALADSVDPTSVGGLLLGTMTGHMALVRLGALLLAFLIALVGPTSNRRRTLAPMSALGAVALGSLAWNGHGAMEDGGLGAPFLAADIVHLLAAGAWVGALVCFSTLLIELENGYRKNGPASVDILATHRALSEFSGVGTILVALLVLTGLVSGWRLVGPGRLSELFTSLYGRLLSAKLVLVMAMLALAAMNRFRLTPAMGREPSQAIAPRLACASLRRSVVIETSLSIMVLALVSWLGTLDPPMAMP
jgi:putative copper resistance protein D